MPYDWFHLVVECGRCLFVGFCCFITGLFVWELGASSGLVWGDEVDSSVLVWGARWTRGVWWKLGPGAGASSGVVWQDKADSSVLVWGDEVDSWLIR